MIYEKLTPTRFAENLTSGKYSNIAGARRAIGKADWNEKDKEKARSMADEHFGVLRSTEITPTTPKKSPGRPKKAENIPAEDKQQVLDFSSDASKLDLAEKAIAVTSSSLAALTAAPAGSFDTSDSRRLVANLITLINAYHILALRLLGVEDENSKSDSPNGVSEEAEKKTLFPNPISH